MEEILQMIVLDSLLFYNSNELSKFNVEEVIFEKIG